jgi:hypothetical protein
MDLVSIQYNAESYFVEITYTTGMCVFVCVCVCVYTVCLGKYLELSRMK